MPERPDLEYVVPILDREVRGKTITAVEVEKPVVLRVALAEPVGVLVGRTIASVERRAHFVVFDLGVNLGEPRKGDPQTPPGLAIGPQTQTSTGLAIVVAPMLAGRFTLAAASDKKPADLAMSFALSDGRELRYRDDVQMGKVYVLEKGNEKVVPGLATIGVDVLDKKAFTKAAFRAIAKKRRDQVKVFLMDKTALDSMGNAYADEVMFEAKIHPKTFVRSLPPESIDRLHDAIVRVLTDAGAEVARQKPRIDEKLRDFLKVRNRHGEPCPRCGAKIRKAGVHGHDAFFCPECQPDDRQSAIVDFRRTKPQ